MSKRKKAPARRGSDPTAPGAAGKQPEPAPRIGWPAALLLAGALLIKLVVALQLSDHPMLQPMGALDTAFYVEAAQRVAGGDWLFGSEAFYASPLYIYFLALIFRIAGPSLLAARLVQAVLGTLGVGLAMATARRWFDRPSSLVTGALLALSGILTFFEVVILQSALDPVLMALDGFLVTRAAREKTPQAWALAGAGLGLHALNRPNLLLCIAVLILLAAFQARRATGKWESALRIAAGIALGSALAIAPATVRNWAVSGEAILITSHGGLNFFIGNHDKADGAYQPIEGISATIRGQAADARKVAGAALGRALTDREVSSYFYRKALAWMADNPYAALNLAGRKLFLLLNAGCPSLNYSYPFFRREEPTWLRFLPVGTWLLVPLGMTGFLLLLHGSASPSGIGAWTAVTAAYAASVLLFFVTDRYQLPLLVPLSVAAGRAATLLWSLRHEPARMTLPLAALAVFLIVANIDPGEKYDQEPEERARLAVALIQRGEASRAEELLARTEKDHRDSGLLHYRAGLAYANRHEYDAAATHLRRALELQPDQPKTNLLLGQVLLDQGRAAEAVPYLEKAAERDGEPADAAALDLVRALAKGSQPEEAAARLAGLKIASGWSTETLLALGTLGLELRRPAEALRFLDAAAAQSPSDPAVGEKRAVALGMSGNLPAAVMALEKAILQAPRNPNLHLNLAVTYAQSGNMEKARQEAEEALRLKPDYPQARGLLERLRQQP